MEEGDGGDGVGSGIPSLKKNGEILKKKHSQQTLKKEKILHP